MLPYGQTKRGSHKLHPHNECSICSENFILKNTARKAGEKEIEEQLNSDLFDLFACDGGCPYCSDEIFMEMSLTHIDVDYYDFLHIVKEIPLEGRNWKWIQN